MTGIFLVDPVRALLGVHLVAMGLAIGSFLNVVIDRMPADRSLLPRSACDVCGEPIRARDNIPVLSYLILRGKCRACGTAIPPSTPLVELLGGLLAWLTFQQFVPPLTVIDAGALAAWAVYFGFLAALTAAAYIDLRHRILPDELTIYALPFAIVLPAGARALGYDGWPYVTWKAAFLGAAVWGGLFAMTSVFAGRVLGREGLGWGDVKLAALLGALLGPIPGGMLALTIGTMLASVGGLLHLVWTRRRGYLPLGPYLALATAATLLFGEEILAWMYPGIQWHVLSR